MGQSNVATKQYMASNDKFADLCNYFLYDGKPVIKPEDLTEKDVTELGIPFEEKDLQALEKTRDLLKSCTVKSADGITYLIIGIENQTDIHYAMVVRNMVMDALNYAAQVDAYAKKHKTEKDLKGDEFLSGFGKEDTLVPVITITVYWKGGAWDGARSLHEMFRVKNKKILKYIPDYKMNLVVPDEIEDFSKFSTELGQVFEYCQCSNDKEKLRKLIYTNSESGFILSAEAMRLLKACLNVSMKVPKKKGDVEDVCEAERGLIEEARAEGEAEGRAKGEARLSKLIQTLLQNGNTDDVLRVTQDEKFREECYTLYNL